MKFVLSFLISFLIGAIPTAYLAGKYLKKTDIREYGSGNVGATNAFRVFGKMLGISVFALDFAKGFLPAYFTARIVYGAPIPDDLNMWIALGAILGHIYTPFLGFKGGKGIATGGGVLCALFPAIFFIIISVWILVFILTRIVSLSSLAALVTLVICSFIFNVGWQIGLYFVLLLLIALWTHRENIQRLRSGEEKNSKKHIK